MFTYTAIFFAITTIATVCIMMNADRLAAKNVVEPRAQLVVGEFVFWYYTCPICGSGVTSKAGQVDGEVVCPRCEKGLR